MLILFGKKNQKIFSSFFCARRKKKQERSASLPSAGLKLDILSSEDKSDNVFLPTLNGSPGKNTLSSIEKQQFRPAGAPGASDGGDMEKRSYQIKKRKAK